jgi:hypothetical protein
MKEAMWKVDALGEFRFSDVTDPNQMVMFNEPSFDSLRSEVLTRFSNRTATVAEVEEFVLAKTAFRETHYKKQILAPLEAAGQLTVLNPKPNRRAGQYGDPKLRLQFPAS